MNILALKLHLHIDFYLFTVVEGGMTKFRNIFFCVLYKIYGHLI